MICFLVAALFSFAGAVSGATEKPVLRVGIAATDAPVLFLNEQQKPDGLAIEFLRHFAEQKGYALQWNIVPAAQARQAFKTGAIDLLANESWRSSDSDWATFSLPHAKMEVEIFLRKGVREVRSLADLKSLRVAVVPQTGIGDLLVAEGFGSQLRQVDSLDAELEALHQNRADAALVPRQIGRLRIKSARLDDIVPTGIVLEKFVVELASAIQPENRKLVYELNQFLADSRVNGTFADTYRNWGLSPDDTVRTPLSARTYLILALIIIPAVVLFLIQRRLLRHLRRQTEALRQSEERLTLIVEGSEDAFWDWDVSTGYVDRSDQWTRFLGYPKDQIAPHIDAFLNIIHPDDFAHHDQAKRHILSEGQCRVEYRLKGADGSWRWIYDRGKVVSRDSSGKPLRVTGAATDVTIRKRIEHALVRSQALLEQTQEAAEMGGWEYDTKSQSFFWTKQVFRIHHLDPEDENLSLDRVAGFCSTQYQKTFRNAVTQALAYGNHFDIEVELNTARNSSIWVRYIGRVELAGKSVARLYGSIQDITSRRQADDEREKIQLKMLEAQKLESLGVLAGGIAHDFNNILTVIMGSASLAKEEPSMVAESLEHIQTASNRAADLCRQMLAYAGKSRFSLEIQDINEIVRGTADLLRLSIRKNAELELSYHDHVLSVEADSSQLRQVIMNLVINASDAIGDGNGRIKVSTRLDTVTREKLREARIGQDAPPGNYVVVEVSDTGSGMSPETMNRIFDPFFTTKFTGRGLGLAAVLGIVRAHKGAFFVRSTVGKGSAFTLLLPLNAATPVVQVAATPVRPVKVEKTGGKILVVDDEPDVRKISGTILEKQGYTVTLASDGYEALALALAHGMQFRCVVLDLTMPGLDGPSTFREIRALSRSVPILIMSGFSEADARKQISVDTRVGFLAKPFPAEELVRKIQSLPLPNPASNPPFNPTDRA